MIFWGHKSVELAQQQFDYTEQILEKLSLQTKSAKAKPPKQVQIWLGKEYNTRNRTVKLPLLKVKKYISDLKAILLNKKSITKRLLLKHIGRTRHMAVIYRSLAAFARNLEYWAYSVSKLDHHIHLSRSLKNDIKLCIWSMNQLSTRGVPFDFI